MRVNHRSLSTVGFLHLPTSIWEGLVLQELWIEAWFIPVIPQPLHCAVHREAPALLALSLPPALGSFFLRFLQQQEEQMGTGGDKSVPG